MLRFLAILNGDLAENFSNKNEMKEGNKKPPAMLKSRSRDFLQTLLGSPEKEKKKQNKIK